MADLLHSGIALTCLLVSLKDSNPKNSNSLAETLIQSWTSYSDICHFYIELGMDPHRRSAVNVCLPSWQAANTSFKPNSMDKNLGASHTCENLCWCLGKNEGKWSLKRL
ncbi:hypothetical protein P8452_60313 [Trifolium repens]|nr:hypothetical protein P8452_60313 [Trifolium repens]